MQVSINNIFDFCSTLVENMTFSNILAIFAVVIAFFAFRSSKKISQGQLFANFLNQYASKEMCNYIRRVRNWSNNNNDDPIEIWWKALLDSNSEKHKEAISVDEARRYISSYFYSAKQLQIKNLISSDLYQIILGQLGGTDLLDNIIDPMTKKFTDEGYPTVPEIG